MNANDLLNYYRDQKQKLMDEKSEVSTIGNRTLTKVREYQISNDDYLRDLAQIEKLKFADFQTPLISNVTANEIQDKVSLKDLLVKQIESRVRWRESVLYMINNGVNQFIEIGPGKVLSGLVKRIDKNVKISAINKEEDISIININD